MKLLLTMACTLASVCLTAQDVKTVKKAYESKALDKAQAAVDALMAKDDKKAENWFWKHKVYYAISESEQYSKLVPDARLTGWQALKKYNALDPDLKVAITDNIIGYQDNFQAYYNKFINAGSTTLNANNYTEALANFKNALSVTDIYYAKKWIPNVLDTTITFYAGYAADRSSTNNDDAELYYKRIVDANAYGTDFHIAYGWLANYYLNTKKETAKGNEVVEKGLKLYPTNEYLVNLKNNAIKNSGDWNAILANGEANVSKPTATYTEYINYGSELFDYLYSDTVKRADQLDREKRLEEVLTKALSFKPNSAETNFIFGSHHTNKAARLDREAKKLATKKLPADVAAKKQIETQRDAEINAALSNLELAASIYKSKGANIKATDKDNYKSTLRNLINLYKFKANPDRAKNYDAELKALG